MKMTVSAMGSGTVKKAALAVLVLLLAAGFGYSRNKKIEPAPNGIALPAGFEAWRLVSVSLRADNDTIRAILGNKTAIKAVKNGKLLPWPDGTVLAKLVWKQKTLEAWPSATVPGDIVHAEFMVKDSVKYAATGGWGFARWLGPELKPYGKEAGFAQECFSCHTPMKDSDYVFTRPAFMPGTL
jgi:hypothetical protein